MANCGPSCTIPSVASSPVVGFGSAGSGGLAAGNLGFGGLGGLAGNLGFGDLGGLGAGNLGLGGLGYGYGPTTLAGTSGSLGTLAGVIPSCVNQIPSAEILIQPPASMLTIPGHILSATCEPTTVGGNTPCAVSGSGITYSRNLCSPNLFGGYLGGRRNICL